MTPRWQEVKKVLAAALERAPEERRVYLDQACTDADFRREVESLIAAQEQGDSRFLEQEMVRSVPLEKGSQLGQYTIVALIGAGGMGEVYRARDARLNRDVAIKVLPSFLSDDRDRLRRFEQEARAAAALNHPNVLGIFQMGTHDGAPYLVSELLEGSTLREQLKHGPLSLRKAVDFGTQIAGGLAAAHEKGIVHRDLKPENLFITKDGRVKILDFGLAKLMPRTLPVDSSAPTVTSMTEPGVVLGTVGYMSPEQVTGGTADHRADIFAFGAVLYEMLTGKRAFQKNTPAETMSAILNEEPPVISEVAPQTPAPLQRFVRRCLEKHPEQRFQSASDLAFALDALSETTVTSQSAIPRSGMRRTWLWAVAALAAAVGVWVIVNWPRPEIRNPLSNAQFTPLTDFKGTETNPAISPDGKFVVFISNRGGAFDVWLMQSNGSSLANLTQGRIGDARAPLRAVGFSPDGSEVWSGGTPQRRLMLWPLMGGVPHNFLDAHAAEVSWSPDGSRLVYHTYDPGDPMFVADYNGANQREIVQSEPGLHNHFQAWAPDGRCIYFVRGRPATREMDLWRISPDGKDFEQLTHLDSDIAYPTPIDEHTILFVAHNQDGAGPWLWAFDTRTRGVRRVSSGVEEYTAIAATIDGRRLAASVVNPRADLWSVPISNRVAEEQSVRPFQLPTVRAQAPRFGGGSLFYLSSRDGADGLWRYRDGQALEIWAGSEGALRSPAAVSADGQTVAFALRRHGKQQMHVMAADGTQLRELSSDVDARGTASWSPDSKWIVVAGSDAAGPGLFKMPADGGTPVRIATGTLLDPVWSPRGDVIVYSGTQVFTVAPLLAVRPDGTPVKLPKINIQREGERARFLPDGSGLVYMAGDTLAGQDFWLLDLRTMLPRRLTRLTSSAVMRTFDITPDGSRIVFDRLQESSDIVLIDLPMKR
jgi:serine/threonine protein kinase